MIDLTQMSGGIADLQGGTIALKTISNKTYDPRNPLRVINGKIIGMTLNNVQNIVFDSVEMENTISNGALLAVNSKGINIVNAKVSGDKNTTPQGQKKHLLTFRNCDGFSVKSSELSHSTVSLSMLQSRNGAIELNKFHDQAVDAVHIDECQKLKVLNNYCTKFVPVAVGGNATHPDFIQFMQQAVGAVCDDIEIAYNLFVRGSGTKAQGIFIRPYAGYPNPTRLKIVGNAMLGGSPNGIALTGDGYATDNIVISYPGQLSRIGSAGFKGIISRNRATKFVNCGADPSNTLIPYMDEAAALKYIKGIRSYYAD